MTTIQVQKKPSSILQDDRGNNSSGRLMSIALIASAIAIGFFVVWKPEGRKDVGVNVLTMFLVAGMGGKVAGKYVEGLKQ